MTTVKLTTAKTVKVTVKTSATPEKTTKDAKPAKASKPSKDSIETKDYIAASKPKLQQRIKELTKAIGFIRGEIEVSLLSTRFAGRTEVTAKAPILVDNLLVRMRRTSADGYEAELNNAPFPQSMRIAEESKELTRLRTSLTKKRNEFTKVTEAIHKRPMRGAVRIHVTPEQYRDLAQREVCLDILRWRRAEEEALAQIDEARANYNRIKNEDSTENLFRNHKCMERTEVIVADMQSKSKSKKQVRSWLL